MSNTTLTRVPNEWLHKQRKISQATGLSIPQTIVLQDGLLMQLAKKNKGRKGSVFEISFPKK